MWLARGCTAVVNGSRAHLAQALARYPRAVVVHVNAAPDILEARLGARARETPGQVAARLARRATFTMPQGVPLTVIDNSGALEEAGHALVEVVRRAATRR